MAIGFKNILIIFFLFFSCNENTSPDNMLFGHSNCRYKQPKEIFNDSTLYQNYSFELKDNFSIEKITFKKTFASPFKHLAVIQEGCDILIQHFIFEGGEHLAENFYFLGSLKKEYAVYLFLADKLKEINNIKLKEVKKLNEKFYIKIERIDKTTIKISMGDTENL